MARPERIKKSQLFRLMSVTPPWVLVRNTMPQAITSTTAVRMAVARLEGTPSMPTFAKMEVRAAKTADKSAKTNHITASSFQRDFRRRCQRGFSMATWGTGAHSMMKTSLVVS